MIEIRNLTKKYGDFTAVDDMDIGSDGVRTKAILCYVPDRPYLYEKLTGRELLEFVVNLYGREWRDCEARAMDLLRYFDIEGWTNSRIENYSHGMKQKLVIVSSLVHDPSVLVVDEPMVGLDALAQKQVKTLL